MKDVLQMVWTEEETFGNMKKKNRAIFTKVQEEKSKEYTINASKHLRS